MARKSRIPVEESSGNVFRDLGFPNPELERRRAFRELQRNCRAKKRKLTEAQQAELDRRLAAYEADGNPGRPAVDAIADIRGKL